jgi:tetratricopeptide (TPR) repeat protein
MKNIHWFLKLLVLVPFLLIPGWSIATEDTFERGLRFLTTQRYDLAAKAFSEAIEVNPRNAVAYCNRGVARFFIGDHEGAIEDFTRALKINPRYTEAYCNRGGLLAKKGDYEKAVADYTKALKINPQYPVAYCGRGIARANSGEYDLAIADFTEAIRIDSRYADAYCNRGAAWFFKGDYARAIDDCTKALEIDSGYAVAYLNRGRAWFSRRECGRAIEDFEKALEVNPSFGEAYNQLAWTLAVCPDGKYRDGAKALEYAKKVMELNPTEDYRATLAAAYAAAGRFEEAVKTQENVNRFLREKGKKRDLSEYEKRLAVYAAHKPWRENYVIKDTTEKKAEQAKRKPVETAVKKMPKQLLKTGVSPKKPDLYPYTIQVASYKDHGLSNRIVTDLREKSHFSFSSLVQIPGKGEWTRVFIGLYENRKKAERALSRLSKEEFPHAYVVKRPYAIEVGASGSVTENRKTEADLKSKGYISYRIGGQRKDEKARIMIGAFSSKMEAEELANRLKSKGFSLRVVLR